MRYLSPGRLLEMEFLMATDFEIGRVLAVDTSEVSIELNPDLKGMSRSTYEGSHEVGGINSYVIVQVGANRLVAMVTRVTLVEEAKTKEDRTVVALPVSRRLMRATIIGTINGNSFQQGVTLFPFLDSPVRLASQADLDAIFGPILIERTSSQPNELKYCLPIGDSAIMQGRPIRIDPDAFFGKHAAVLGSTGSGKSCTIASILQSVHSLKEVKRTTCVILDTNGEYRSAFRKNKCQNDGDNTGIASCLYISSDSSRTEDHLAIPYWFMDATDFMRIFRASEGLQAPVLLRALKLARAGASENSSVMKTVEILRVSANKIRALCENTSPKQQWAIPGNIIQLCTDGLKYKDDFSERVHRLNEELGSEVFETWHRALEQIRMVARDADQRGEDGGLGATRLQIIQNTIDPVIKQCNEIIAQNPGSYDVPVTADQPLYFERTQFLESALETAMREQADSGNSGRIREACGPMFLRIRRFFEDPRFKFLFDRYPNVDGILAAFLRDLLGIGSSGDRPLSSSESNGSGCNMPFYDRQLKEAEAADIVILDLSLLSAEVLEHVTALIGRLILEFLQRLGEQEAARGSLPVILVLEEAQNYIQRSSLNERDSIARVVYERIAREGRKFGLSLVVASQRPSELSRTVLSQCSSFIVHRLQNPEDLYYFREIVPAIYGPMLEQIPTLEPGTAIVLGNCVSAPALVKIRKADPTPDSRDPQFYKHWTQEEIPPVPVEDVCSHWEQPPKSAGTA